VPYFHNVFTLPHDFHALILFSERNQRALLKLLFDAAAQTLQTFGRTQLGGKIGFTLVLHTWDQRLHAHFHVHALIASGALSEDGSRWIAGGRKFLFPVHGLSKVFRIRHYGLLANCVKAKHLARCRELLGVRPSPKSDDGRPSAAEWLWTVLGIDTTRCPCCGQPLYRQILRPTRRPTAVRHDLTAAARSSPWDTS